MSIYSKDDTKNFANKIQGLAVNLATSDPENLNDIEILEAMKTAKFYLDGAIRRANAKDTNGKDWRVVIDDTGGPFSGWPSVWSDNEDRSVIHRAGFIQEYWHGPSQYEALQIAQVVADYMNKE